MKARFEVGQNAAPGLFSHLVGLGHCHRELDPPARGGPECASERCNNIDTGTLQELDPIFEIADDLTDADRLRQLFVGYMESCAPSIGKFPACIDAWYKASVRRPVPRDPLGTAVLPKLLKSIFDFYFRDDLYGHWAFHDPIVLSSGSFDETVFGLPESLKTCIRYALAKNWYGYSDSLGRMSAREALADLETTRSGGRLRIDPEQIAVTLGGTAALASIVDLLTEPGRAGDVRALCGIPNYPPLVAALGRRLPVEFCATPTIDGHTDISALTRAATRRGARIILLQTVTNPTGLRVSEEQLRALIASVPTDCFVLLDECHDSFGPTIALTSARLASNVISIRSMSKRWAAPGLKVGWIVGAADFIDAFYTHASTTYGGPPSFFYLLTEMFALFEAGMMRGGIDVGDLLPRLSADYGLTAGYLEAGFADYAEATDSMTARVLASRRYTVDALRDAGTPALMPDYSINVLAKIGDLPSYATYRHLVSEAGVSVYPTVLCLTGGAGQVRISPCLPEATLAEAMRRLTRWSERSRG